MITQLKWDERKKNADCTESESALPVCYLGSRQRPAFFEEESHGDGSAASK
jgi:hypothetical protein